jgi:probable O-glycosylation ligase (exosortase A-associated)
VSNIEKPGVEMELEATRANDGAAKSSSRFGFVVTILYLFLDYARPQDTISFIGALRPGLILALLLLIALFFDRDRIRLAASAQTSRVVLFLILLALHVPFSFNTGRAYFATQDFLLNVIALFSIIVFVDSLDRVRILMKWWILMMVYLAVKGILGGGSAGSSFLQDENDFALLMNMMLPFSVFLFFYEQQKKRKMLYMIASLLCIASIIASFSRGGFVGLSLVAFMVWLMSTRKVLLLFVAGIMVSIILNLPITHVGTEIPDSTYWQEMTTITEDSGKDYNKDSRMELWGSAWEMFKDNPLGVGPQNFSVRLPDYQTEYFGDKNMWGKAAHSIWFTLIPELGIPGILLYFSLMLANVRDIRYLKQLSAKEGDTYQFAYFLSLAFAASLIGYFVSGSFLSALYYPHYWYITAMIVATRKAVDRQNTDSLC